MFGYMSFTAKTTRLYALVLGATALAASWFAIAYGRQEPRWESVQLTDPPGYQETLPNPPQLVNNRAAR